MSVVIERIKNIESRSLRDRVGHHSLETRIFRGRRATAMIRFIPSKRRLSEIEISVDRRVNSQP